MRNALPKAVFWTKVRGNAGKWTVQEEVAIWQ